jgi:hypothetical protein
MPTYREKNELDRSITYLDGPDSSLRYLDRGEQAGRAALAIHPPSEDWSDMRYYEVEGALIGRLTVEATVQSAVYTDNQGKLVEDEDKLSATRIDCTYLRKSCCQ